MPHNRWIVATTWLLLGSSLSQVPAASSLVLRPGESYAIDTWSNEDGLPHSAVIALTQTRDGYLWLGTLRGLVRFDGVRFVTFDEINTPGLNSSQIIHLFEDSRRNLWIGTETAGLALAHDGSVTNLGIGKGSREGRLVSICEDVAGAVWPYAANGQLWRIQAGRTARFGVGTERFSFSRSVIAEPGGPLWVGADWFQLGLDYATATESAELPILFRVPTGKLDYLLPSAHGGYWRLADGSIQRWHTNRLARKLGDYGWTSWRTRVSAACEDQQGNLVVGTLGEGVFWYDAQGGYARLTGSRGLTHDTILSLCVDREGCLWVGTDGGGLIRVKRQMFEVLEESRGVTVQTVAEDARGGLWFGTFGGGLNYWSQGKLQRYGREQGLTDLYVRALLVDSNQTVWVGTSVGGLFYWHEGSFRPAELPSREVTALHQDRRGRLWAGTTNGLAQWDGQAWRLFTTSDGLSSEVVRAIVSDAEGNLWVGTVGGGLNLLRDGRFKVFRKSNGLPSDDISSLWLDADGVLWIGTTGSGLARFERGQWTRFTTHEGLASNGIGYLMEDDQGFLWIGSSAGLMRVAKNALNDFASGKANSISCRTYMKEDGLPTRECSSDSQPGPYRTRDGRLWFPTTKGLVAVNPAKLTPNPHQPPVVIESVLVDDQPQTTPGIGANSPPLITLSPRNERLDIHYTSLNLAAPDRARFRCRLEGHESRWTEMGNTRVAHYSKLPPGRFTFQVTAANEDGVWNEAGRSLVIVVEPPFWRTWWFLTLAATALLGTVIAVVHFVSTQKLQRQLANMRQKEALERERARIARDLHDQLGANLTQIALLGELAESDKELPAEIETHARQISQTARDTTSALDQIVWSANPANDTLDGLVNYACQYAQEYFALAGLRYRLEAPEPLPSTPIAPEVRHNVFLAFKEAVNNVVKHSGASAAWVRLRLEPDRFVLEVEDNGRGLSAEAEHKGRNGLRNMRKRLEDVGGTFAIDRGADHGALVRLTVPLAKG